MGGEDSCNERSFEGEGYAFIDMDQKLEVASVNVSRMLPKLLRTQAHIVQNRGITMAPLFLSLTS